MPAISPAAVKKAANVPADPALSLYQKLSLEEKGLSFDAFSLALKGYNRLLANNRITRTGIISICDFSQSSGNKRMYIVDLDNQALFLQTYVAHGRNSGGEFATRFSNKPESLQSSLGFYVTSQTYQGAHGLSLRMMGQEPGINDKALQRNIVVHGADYIEEEWLRKSDRMGRSFGCPAVPADESAHIINTIKNGTCLFIYHPGAGYVQRSKILNG